MDTNPMTLSPYTLGFSLAAREIASGENYPEACRDAAACFGADGFKQFVHGYLSAYAVDADLNEQVA